MPWLASSRPAISPPLPAHYRTANQGRDSHEALIIGSRQLLLYR